MRNLIIESEKEIQRKSEESKNIISYYQVANGENAYLEYAFGATDYMAFSKHNDLYYCLFFQNYILLIFYTYNTL